MTVGPFQGSEAKPRSYLPSVALSSFPASTYVYVPGSLSSPWGNSWHNLENDTKWHPCSQIQKHVSCYSCRRFAGRQAQRKTGIADYPQHYNFKVLERNKYFARNVKT